MPADPSGKWGLGGATPRLPHGTDLGTVSQSKDVEFGEGALQTCGRRVVQAEGQKLEALSVVASEAAGRPVGLEQVRSRRSEQYGASPLRPAEVSGLYSEQGGSQEGVRVRAVGTLLRRAEPTKGTGLSF